MHTLLAALRWCYVAPILFRRWMACAALRNLWDEEVSVSRCRPHEGRRRIGKGRGLKA